VRVDFEALLGRDAFEAYWRELDRVVEEMERSQSMANELRAKIAAAAVHWQVRAARVEETQAESIGGDAST
jgi:hypothetical protein